MLLFQDLITLTGDLLMYSFFFFLITSSVTCLKDIVSPVLHLVGASNAAVEAAAFRLDLYCSFILCLYFSCYCAHEQFIHQNAILSTSKYPVFRYFGLVRVLFLGLLQLSRRCNSDMPKFLRSNFLSHALGPIVVFPHFPADRIIPWSLPSRWDASYA